MADLLNQPVAEGPEPGITARRRGFSPHLIAPYSLVILVVLEVVVFSILRPDTFATSANWQTTLQSISVNLVVAVALLIPLVAGRFDISLGSNIGLTAILSATAMSHSGWGLLPAILLGIGIGAAIGVVNGLLVAYLRVDSLVVTLGTATFLVGVIQWRSGGEIISSGISEDLTRLGFDKVLGVPVTFLIALGIAAVVWYLLTQTVFGRRLDAVGSNEASAVLVGINVRRVIFTSFVLSGIGGALAAFLMIANQGAADPSVGGVNVLLPALAGAFLGASAFTPGKYNVPGTVFGLIFVAVAVSGLALLGAAPWVQPIFNGAAIVIAVSLSTYLHRSVRVS